MTKYNLEVNATPAYAAPLRKGGSNLRPESVISFLTRNESGDRCLYRVSDHLPTVEEIHGWLKEENINI